MSPLISVIIPVYRHENELGLALASINRQTYPRLEIIIVDDGNQPALQLSPEVKPWPISVIRQNHLGAPAARNLGFSKSNGEYIIFWDADVAGEPDMLLKLYNALQAHPEASYAYSNFYFGKKKMSAQKFSSERLRQTNFITSTSLIHREHFLPWDEGIKRFQDWDLWLTLLENGHTGIWVPEYLFRIQPRSTGISHWLPRQAYHAPWRWLPGIRSKVRAYEAARLLIERKHQLQNDEKE